MEITSFLVPAAVLGVGWITIIVAAVVAIGITVSMKIEWWSALIITPILIIAWYILWAVVKTVVEIAIVIAICVAVLYGVRFIFLKPTSAPGKK